MFRRASLGRGPRGPIFPDNTTDAPPIVFHAIVPCYGLLSLPESPCALRCPARRVGGVRLVGDDGITDRRGWRRGCCRLERRKQSDRRDDGGRRRERRDRR